MTHNDTIAPDANVSLACDFLINRSTFGLQKYGCPTTDIEQLAEIQHALEEVNDLFVYLIQVQRAMQGMVADKKNLIKAVHWFMDNAEVIKPLPDHVKETLAMIERDNAQNQGGAK